MYSTHVCVDGAIWGTSSKSRKQREVVYATLHVYCRNNLCIHGTKGFPPQTHPTRCNLSAVYKYSPISRCGRRWRNTSPIIPPTAKHSKMRWTALPGLVALSGMKGNTMVGTDDISPVAIAASRHGWAMSYFSETSTTLASYTYRLASCSSCVSSAC